MSRYGVAVAVALVLVPLAVAVAIYTTREDSDEPETSQEMSSEPAESAVCADADRDPFRSARRVADIDEASTGIADILDRSVPVPSPLTGDWEITVERLILFEKETSADGDDKSTQTLADTGAVDFVDADGSLTVTIAYQPIEKCELFGFERSTVVSKDGNSADVTYVTLNGTRSSSFDDSERFRYEAVEGAIELPQSDLWAVIRLEWQVDSAPSEGARIAEFEAWVSALLIAAAR